MILDPEIRNQTSRIAKLIRRRFRVPFHLFNEIIVPYCHNANIFGIKCESKIRVPIE